jgi:predicted nucleic acid-binding protein
MTTTASVAEVQSAGVTIEAEEAVAIAQQLIAALRSGDTVDAAEPPYGPPSRANVYLDADGSVICRACETTPAVSEMAILLQAMLPAESGRVPGGLRYSIARALLDVDVPPFDSLDDFADTLRRYERGSRPQMVRRVLQRLDARRALVPMAMADRRRHARATELRRALREADARLYLQKVASEAITVTVTPTPPRPRRLRGAAACVAAGLLLIISGEFIDGRYRAVSPAPPIASPAPPIVSPAAGVIARDVALMPDERRPLNNAEGRIANAGRRPANAERRSVPVKRVVRAQAPRERAHKGSSSRGVLDRLRLNWLRSVFASS